MIKLILPIEASQVRELRLLSLETDPDAFVSTYAYESQFDIDYYSRKISYNLVAPYFGYWGYYKQELLVGYAQLIREQLPRVNHIADIFEFYVHPDFRRQGLGKDLLNHLVQLCKNHPDIELLQLKVTSTNQPAIKLYEAFNFLKTHTQENQIKTNQGYLDETIMCLSLR